MSGSLWTAIYSVTFIPIAFGVNAIVARVLGPTSFGNLAYLTLTLSLLLQITNLGVSDAVIQWGTGAEALGRRQEADQFLRKSLGYHLTFQLPLMLIAAVFLTWNYPLYVKVALLVAVVIPIVFGSSALTLTIENRTASAARLVIVTNLAVQIATALTAVLLRNAASVWATRSLVTAALVPTNLILLSKARRRVACSPLLPRRLPDGFWRYARYSALAAFVATMVFSRSELYYLRWLGSGASVGLYALAYALAAQMTAPVDALLGPLIPAVAGIMSSAPEVVHRAQRRALRLGALGAGAILALVVPPLYFLLPVIFGSQFASSGRILLPLAAISCLQTAFNPVVAFVSGRRRSDILVRAYAAGLAGGAGTALITIPTLGLWGAVAANTVGQSVVFVSLGWFEVHFPGGMTPHSLWLDLRACLAGLGALALAVVVCALVAGDIPRACLSFGVGAGVYFLLIRLTDASLEATEWQLLADILPFRLGNALSLMHRKRA
jgi:O-antigen/teichoic acid export membrane protein